MNQRTLKQNKELHALIGQLGFDDDMKAVLINTYTHGRTMHSSNMSVMECQELINYLHNKVKEKEFEKDKMRKRVISHMKEAGYTLPDGRADMPAIQAWVQRQKYKKQLNKHTKKELSDLIYAADKVRQHFKNKAYE